MKYRMVYSKTWVDGTALKKFIIEETEEYFVISFDEDDANEIASLFTDSIIDEQQRKFEKKLIDRGLDYINCIDENDFLYKILPDGVHKLNGKLPAKKLKKSCIKYYRKLKKLNKESNRMLSETSETRLVEKFSFSRFKAYDFISKENDYVLPYRFKPSKKENQPLVVFTYGLRGFKGSHVWRKIKKHDCSVLVPDIPKATFYGKRSCFESVDVIKQLCDILCDEYKINKNRIYFTGVSGGGKVAWISAYKYPDYYACIVPVMGALTIGDDPDYSRLRHFPIWVAQAEDDKIAGPELNDETVGELRKLGADIKYTRYNKGGHAIAPRFYKKEKWCEWMFSQSLEKRCK